MCGKRNFVAIFSGREQSGPVINCALNTYSIGARRPAGLPRTLENFFAATIRSRGSKNLKRNDTGR